MKNLTLENIAVCCDGIYYGAEEFKKKEINGIEIDSRKVQKGNLFIPIKGERVDGHTFIPNVMEQGALAVLSEYEIEEPKGPYILVKSTAKAMQKIAAYYRDSLGIKVVGITGSVGKTSTKEMIASVLEQKFCVHKTAGNFNNEIGLPLTIFGIRKEHQVAVLEMGISDFGEMHRLAEMAKPDLCVITNIGLCHLENLGDRDGILKAKTEVFEHMQPGGVAILNGLDDKLCQIAQANGTKPLFYGKEGSLAYAADAENLGVDGINITLCLAQTRHNVHIPIPGEHNIWNALAAACVGYQLGMNIEEICAGIEKVQTIQGRNHLIKKHGVTIIDDCYNANPVSMKASLDVLADTPGRKIAVLGDMGELGENEVALHRDIGAYLAAKNIDVLYCAGELSEYLAEEAEKNSNCKVCYRQTKEEWIEQLKTEMKEGDIILVKASHFMDYPKVVTALTEE